MRRLTHEHKLSIQRAICVFRLRAHNQPVKRFRKEWERDIHRLRDILKHVEDSIAEPMFTNLRDEPTALNP